MIDHHEERVIDRIMLDIINVTDRNLQLLADLNNRADALLDKTNKLLARLQSDESTASIVEDLEDERFDTANEIGDRL